MVTCGNCGAQVSIDGQRFCARCGVKLPETETQTTFLHAVQSRRCRRFVANAVRKPVLKGKYSASNAGQDYCQHSSRRHLNHNNFNLCRSLRRRSPNRNTSICSNLCRRLRQGAM